MSSDGAGASLTDIRALTAVHEAELASSWNLTKRMNGNRASAYISRRYEREQRVKRGLFRMKIQPVSGRNQDA